MQQFLAFVSTGRTGVDVEHKANGCRHQLVLPWCQEQVAKEVLAVLFTLEEVGFACSIGSNYKEMLYFEYEL